MSRLNSASRLNSTFWLLLTISISLISLRIALTEDGEILGGTNAVAQTVDDDFEHLQRANRAFIELVNRAKPAVVQVATTKFVQAQSSHNSGDWDEWFEYFFAPPDGRRGRGENQEPPEHQREQDGLGSGVIVSKDGYVLTNNHVIDGADDISVILPGGRKYEAELIGTDAGTDVAVLKIDGENLPALPFGNSAVLEVGEWVVAIGSPFGLSQTVTRGIVSAKDRSNQLGTVRYADFIQTDAPINRGNSGGALINIRGELIGINTAIVTGGNFLQGNVGVGFAIPSNLVQQIMSQLVETGEVERGWLGVNIDQELTYELAQDFDLEEPRGALITGVINGMPADEAGIRHGDVILEFNQIAIRDRSHLLHVVATTEVGKTVDVKISRRGDLEVMRVTLGKRPSDEDLLAMRKGDAPRIRSEREEAEVFAGLHVQNLTDELGEEYGHKVGAGVVIVEIKRGSIAARQRRIRVGDLIQEVDFVEIKDVKHYDELIKSNRDRGKITFYIRHANGGGSYVTLKTEGSSGN